MKSVHLKLMIKEHTIRKEIYQYETGKLHQLTVMLFKITTYFLHKFENF